MSLRRNMPEETAQMSHGTGFPALAGDMTPRRRVTDLTRETATFSALLPIHLSRATATALSYPSRRSIHRSQETATRSRSPRGPSDNLSEETFYSLIGPEARP